MKLVCTESNKETIIKNARKPKMTSGYFGRTWDIIARMTINNSMVKVYADTTWGLNCYFEYNNKWYSVPIWDADYITQGKFILKRGK